MNPLHPDRHALRSAFLRSRQWPYFLLGCCMLATWIAVSAGMWQAGSERWDELLTVGFAHLLAGRAISVAQGTYLGLPKWAITIVATYADITVMLLVFPLFVYSYQNLMHGRFFQKRMRPMLESAQRNVDRFRRYKILGVFVFVWLPFWMTGIIVGAILGHLLGLRTWVAMLTASLGAFAAVSSWVYAYDIFFRWLGRIHQEVPLAFTLALIAALLAFRLLWRRNGAAARARRAARGAERDQPGVQSVRQD